MGDEFYCILKLVSGEEIFSLICVDISENDIDPVIILQNPIEIKVMHNTSGSYIKIKPWMELSSDDIFITRMSKIITMTESKDEKLITLYKNYILDEDTNDTKDNLVLNGNQVKVTGKMGYVSSVEEARNKLENIFKGLKES